MFWKLYFWFRLLLYVLDLVTYNGGFNPAVLWTDRIVTALELLAVFGLAYEKVIWTALFWKLFAVPAIISDLLVFSLFIRVYNPAVAAGSMLLQAPVYVAMFVYIFRFLPSMAGQAEVQA